MSFGPRAPRAEDDAVHAARIEGLVGDAEGEVEPRLHVRRPTRLEGIDCGEDPLRLARRGVGEDEIGLGIVGHESDPILGREGLGEELEGLPHEVEAAHAHRSCRIRGGFLR
jgi:hypothetical protein